MSQPTPSRPWYARPGPVTTIAVTLVVLTIAVRIVWPWYRTRRLIDEVAGRGGHVRFETGGPQWLRNLWSDERLTLLDTASVIIFDGEEFDDADIENVVLPLARWNQIEMVSLSGTRVTDEGLRFLTGCRDLQLLECSGIPITDDGLKHIAQMQHLNSLSLDGTQVTDKGIQQLARLHGLELLSVSNTNVTDAGVEALRKHLPNLQVLDD